MIIGICGKSGSGKSRLSRNIMNLSKNEVVHLDIDKVGHNALTYEEAIIDLVNTFGTEILDGDKINRKILSNIVFDNEKEMSKLTEITWKYMQKEINEFINNNKDKIIILDWLLLPKTDYFDMCDIKILLDIPYEIRKARAIKRDNISSETFDLREKASINFEKEKFDYVIENGEIETVKRLVKLYE